MIEAKTENGIITVKIAGEKEFAVAVETIFYEICAILSKTYSLLEGTGDEDTFFDLLKSMLNDPNSAIYTAEPCDM